MKGKTWVWIVLVIVVLVLGYWWWSNTASSAPAAPAPATTQPAAAGAATTGATNPTMPAASSSSGAYSDANVNTALATISSDLKTAATKGVTASVESSELSMAMNSLCNGNNGLILAFKMRVSASASLSKSTPVQGNLSTLNGACSLATSRLASQDLAGTLSALTSGLGTAMSIAKLIVLQP